MNEDAIVQYIKETFADVDVTDDSGNSFFFYEPGPAPPNRMFPFVTLVTTDQYDQFSDLNRTGVFRLNIGLSRETYHAMFGPKSPDAEASAAYDFTALDKIMPHPVYGSMNWICVLSPSAGTFECVEPLLGEAYQRAHRQTENRG